MVVLLYNLRNQSKVTLCIKLYFLQICRPDTQKILEHPFFWKDHEKMDFLCKVSERIPSIISRDPDSANFLDDLKSMINAELFGSLWCTQLPQRENWGVNQTTPKRASSGNEGETLGLMRFTRNIWTHRVQNIEKGHFVSEDEICTSILGSLPWLITVIYRLCEKHLASNLSEWLKSVARH